MCYDWGNAYWIGTGDEMSKLDWVLHKSRCLTGTFEGYAFLTTKIYGFHLHNEQHI
jgi:hypothetical protein